MSSWEQVVARLYDPVMAAAERGWLGRLRARLLADVGGEVLEIGAGTGANLRHVPAQVTRWTALEPSPAMARRLHVRSGAVRPAVEVLPLPAEALPLPDASVDTVVSTLVLCSVRDLDLALAEARRVLRPSGTFVLIEHVAAHGAALRVQRLLRPSWQRLAQGCSLTRDTRSALVRAGFDVTDVGQAPGAPRLGLLPLISGVAHRC